MEPLIFGKHKNKTVDKVFKEDPSYCQWLLKQKLYLGDDSREYLEEQFKDPYAVYIPFGKHKGKKLRDVAMSCPGYIDWLRGNAFVMSKYPDIHEACKKY